MLDRRKILLGGGACVLAGAGAAYVGLRRMGSMDEYKAFVATSRVALPQTPEMAELIRYATLAPSGHNTQPWRFRIGTDRIDILPDFSRRTPIVDPDDHHLFVGLGCAGETLALAAGAGGRSSELRVEPGDGGSVQLALGGPAGSGSVLFDAIPARQSTRTDYDGKPISLADLRSLAAAAEIPGVDVVLITNKSETSLVRDLVVAGNSAQMADAAFLRELKAWMRFSPREAKRTGDGLFSATTGNPALPEWLGARAFDWAFKAESENDKYSRQIASSAGIAIFASEREDHAHWVLAGRACQRFALQATVLGLKCAFINQPVEVARLRPELAALAGLAGRRPDIVMRFGHGPSLPFSARRPVRAVLEAGGD
jgi:nitroreductase